MENHKRHNPLNIIIILFVIIFATIFLVKGDNSPTKNEQPTNVPENEVATPNPAYKCGLTVTAPLQNNVVSFPLTVSGVVNNQAATDSCTWVLFEGQAGTVSISNGATTYATVPVTLLGDWMTSGPVNFSATLTPVVSIPSGAPLTITFNEENPSDEAVSDTLSFPVVAQ